MNWKTKRLADLITLERGFDLPKSSRIPGKIPVISAGKEEGTHNKARVKGPGFAIGRITNLGRPRWSDIDYWPLNTTLYAKDFHGNNPRWLYYLFKIMDLSGYDSGSVQPALNRNYISEIPVQVPSIKEQDSIVSCISALDDKIAENNKMIRIILELQKSIWIQNNVKNLSQIHLINIAEPILGGTPKRSDNSLWNGDILWASVADMTSVSNSHLLTTAEQITEKAAETKRFAPLPAGSVLLSARGTVGHVISLATPAAFNQSAYGFIAPKGYETALRLAIEDTVEELKSKSYGSVFSTITKQQINECLIPDVFNESFAELHAKLNSLETRIVIAEQENQTLARTRDELLPLLMSGKITVRDAEEASAEVGVDKHEVEE